MNVIIIPAYQPDNNLTEITRELAKRGYIAIVVDDGSGEQYENIFHEIDENMIVLRHKQNLGKGRAIKTALRYIAENLPETDNIVVMDSDGQHRVDDAVRVLNEAEKNQGKLILGSRSYLLNKDKSADNTKIPLASRLGNICTRKLFSLTSGVHVKDTQTGLRAFSKDLIYLFIEVSGDRYEYEMNVLYQCAKRKIDIVEIPIQTVYHDADNSCSHFHKVKDSFRIYKQIIKFALSSFSSFLIDYIIFGLLVVIFADSPYGVVMSNIIARIFSGTYNYIANRCFVFPQQQKEIKSAFQYIILAICILIINTQVLSWLTGGLHMDAMIAKVLTEMVMFVVSFIVQKCWVFGGNSICG